MARAPRPPRARTDSSLSALVDLGAAEHYADAGLYDHDYRNRRADVAWYRSLARRVLGGPGRILELGCGSGRVTLPLARDGHHVVGLDASAPMLARLEARRERAGALGRRIQPVAGDLRDFAIEPAGFPLVIAAFNVLEHLYTRVELALCLAAVERHLAPGGRFAFDVQMPDLDWLTRASGERQEAARFKHPRTGALTIYSTEHDYDPVSQIAMIRIFYTPADGKGPEHSVLLTQRRYFPAELEALCAAAGFAVVERYGDFSDEELSGRSQSQVLVLMRQRDFLDGNRASGSISSTRNRPRNQHPRRGRIRAPSSARRR
ncbi:MAG: class I SAM-dependent methyltransferase [Deltaproteobacteria bacterium]|nr:class I SAM-dependent methyltransferase [Deltaproteobacteria bacterium]